LIGDHTLLQALEARLNVFPPGVASAGRKKPDANLAGAANDFEALERLPQAGLRQDGARAEDSGADPLELAGGAGEEETD